MTNQGYQRMSPGMYRGPNGQVVRSQQMPQPQQRQQAPAQPQMAPPLRMPQQQAMPQRNIDPGYSMNMEQMQQQFAGMDPQVFQRTPQMQWAMQQRQPGPVPQGQPQGILSQPPMMNQMGQMMGGLYKR